MPSFGTPSLFDLFKPASSPAAPRLRVRLALAVGACVLALAACGGGGGGGTSGSGAGGGTADVFTGTNSFNEAIDGGSGFGGGDSGADGTSGEGKPFVNAAVTIIDSAGKSVSATTDAKGYYKAKITGFVPPLLAKATLGDKTYFSVATATPQPNGFVTINITGLTDKIASDVALAAGRTSSASLTPGLVTQARLDAAKASLRAALATQLAANGLNATTFDPVTLPFRANGTGYDAVLDTTLVTKNGTGSTVITPNGQVLVTGLDTSGIAILVAQFNSFGSTLAGSYGPGIAALLDAGFLDSGASKSTTLARWQANPTTKEVRNASFKNCDAVAQTCQLGGQFYANGVLDGDIGTTGLSAKLVGGVWRLFGDRAPVNIDFRSQAQRTIAYSAPPLPTFLNWAACVSGAASDPNLANNNATGVTAVTGGNTLPLVIGCTGTTANVSFSVADLYASLLAPSSAAANQTVIATVTFANAGTGSAIDATGTVVKPDGSTQTFPLGNMGAGATATHTVAYVVTYGSTPAPVTTNAFGYSGFVDATSGKYKSAKFEFYGFSGFTAASPFLALQLNTKPACTGVGNFLQVDDGNSSYCDIFLTRNDSQLNSLNTSFASGSVTQKITLYEAINYTGTATVVIRGFNQVFLTSTSPAPAYSSVANPASFQAGSVNYTAPVPTLYNVYIEVYKRNNPSPAFLSGRSRWSDSAAVGLANNVSLAKAELLCGNCGSYSGANNPQITYMRTDGNDTAGRGVATVFTYPYSY